MEKTVEQGRLLGLDEVADGIFCAEVLAPFICEHALPGQFVQVKVEEASVQLLRIPLCVYDVNPEINSIELFFEVRGEGTEQLSRLHMGDAVSIVGPLGDGWHIPADMRSALLIGGGLGAATLNLLARAIQQRGASLDFVLGVPSADQLAFRDRFERSVELAGGSLKIATDDGSEGHHGLCTDLSDPLIAEGGYDYIAVCGPTPMLRAAVPAAIASDAAVEVCLESLMACGIGACLSCVVKTTDGLKRCCTDGTVFDAREVLW
ncbi:MAG: dihydroorotate dehydrogenase electron transfer subunit [Coriobacteriaceae bacterium]|nr:dihydroorotate dehydrogenase electron transfer subunit [Coriobacteriaceae bacterium]